MYTVHTHICIVYGCCQADRVCSREWAEKWLHLCPKIALAEILQATRSSIWIITTLIYHIFTSLTCAHIFPSLTCAQRSTTISALTDLCAHFQRLLTCAQNALPHFQRSTTFSALTGLCTHVQCLLTWWWQHWHRPPSTPSLIRVCSIQWRRMVLWGERWGKVVHTAPAWHAAERSEWD